MMSERTTDRPSSEPGDMIYLQTISACARCLQIGDAHTDITECDRAYIRAMKRLT